MKLLKFTGLVIEIFVLAIIFCMLTPQANLLAIAQLILFFAIITLSVIAFFYILED